MSVYNDILYPALPVFAQNIACSAVGAVRFRSRFSSHFKRVLKYWERSVDFSTEELHLLQRNRLDHLISRARDHVPYYRDLSPPSTAKDPKQAIEENLSSIPPLEKREYRDQSEAFLARDVGNGRLHRVRTSGTTGTAIPIWHTPQTLAEEYATVWRLRRSCGVEGPSTENMTFSGNIVVPFSQSSPPYWRYNAFAKQHFFSIYHMGPANLRAYVDKVHTIDAKYVQGYPSSIHLVARALLESGKPLEPGRLNAVFTSSETLLSFQRATIEEAFGAPIRDRYGVSEFGVSMTECGQGNLHVDMEFGIVEVDVTEETETSETGPLLITGLAHSAMPLLRYKIGDVGTRSKTPCHCGRAGDVFLQVDGRVEDYIMTPDGRLVGRLDHVFKEQLAIDEAQIVQERRDAIKVFVVPGQNFDDTESRRLERSIRSRLGSDINIEIVAVSTIAREPNGKFRAVKSSVGRINA